jgi:hypothetical protein
MKRLFWFWMVCAVVLGNGAVAANHYMPKSVLGPILFMSLFGIGAVLIVMSTVRILRVQAYRYHVLGRRGRDYYFGNN